MCDNKIVCDSEAAEEQSRIESDHSPSPFELASDSSSLIHTTSAIKSHCGDDNGRGAKSIYVPEEGPHAQFSESNNILQMDRNVDFLRNEEVPFPHRELELSERAPLLL